jgi:hypothetical protein
MSKVCTGSDSFQSRIVTKKAGTAAFGDVDTLQDTLNGMFGYNDAVALVEIIDIVAVPLTTLRPASRKVTRSESINL